jgi:hypothetical protein
MGIDQPRGACRRHVDARAEQFDVIGDRERDQRVGVVGGRKADGLTVGEFAGILADLVLGMHPHPDEIEGPLVDGADRDRSDTTRRPHRDSKLTCCHRSS